MCLNLQTNANSTVQAYNPDPRHIIKRSPSDLLTTKEVSFPEIGIGDQGELLIHGVNISTFGSIDVGHCMGTIVEILYFFLSNLTVFQKYDSLEAHKW